MHRHPRTTSYGTANTPPGVVAEFGIAGYKILDIRMINYQRMSYYKMLIYLIQKIESTIGNG